MLVPEYRVTVLPRYYFWKYLETERNVDKKCQGWSCWGRVLWNFLSPLKSSAHPERVFSYHSFCCAKNCRSIVLCTHVLCIFLHFSDAEIKSRSSWNFLCLFLNLAHIRREPSHFIWTEPTQNVSFQTKQLKYQSRIFNRMWQRSITLPQLPTIKTQLLCACLI